MRVMNSLEKVLQGKDLERYDLTAGREIGMVEFMDLLQKMYGREEGGDLGVIVLEANSASSIRIEYTNFQSPEKVYTESPETEKLAVRATSANKGLYFIVGSQEKPIIFPNKRRSSHVSYALELEYGGDTKPQLNISQRRKGSKDSTILIATIHFEGGYLPTITYYPAKPTSPPAQSPRQHPQGSQSSGPQSFRPYTS